MLPVNREKESVTPRADREVDDTTLYVFHLSAACLYLMHHKPTHLCALSLTDASSGKSASHLSLFMCQHRKYKKKIKIRRGLTLAVLLSIRYSDVRSWLLRSADRLNLHETQREQNGGKVEPKIRLISQRAPFVFLQTVT